MLSMFAVTLSIFSFSLSIYLTLSILAESRPNPDGEQSERGRSSSHEEEVLSQRGQHDKGVSCH